MSAIRNFLNANLKEHICVKFCFKLRKTASQTHDMLKTAFSDNAMGRTQTFECFFRFKSRETSVEDCEHSGCPSIADTQENVEKVCRIVIEDQQSTISETASRLGLLYETCQQILTEDLNIWQISAKFVPRLLTDNQK
jgi:hypothetical protein